MQESINQTRNTNKRTRLQVIRMIVGNSAIESQEILAREMDKAGFPSTQTTLSRDLKQLRISKVRTRSGKSVYALPGTVQFEAVATSDEIRETRWSLLFGNSMAIIHTPPGHASMVAYDIDETRSPLILGTIAGDDTVFVALSVEAEREKVEEVLYKVVPRLKKNGR